LARKLDGFQMSHTVRGGNKEADRLANEAMDRGMGKGSGANGVSRAGGIRADAYAKPPRAPQPAQNAPKQPRVVLEGYVKDGVVHLLEGELPDGVFVKVIRE
jgi:probable phosphoglycerate mutase